MDFLINKLIIITGFTSTGKSTFAQRLSSELGVPCFLKDKIIEAMGDGFGQDSYSKCFKNDTRAMINVLLYIAEGFLQTGKVCILEANFRRPFDMQIKTLLGKYNAECLNYFFTGNLDVLWDRYVGREAERHWAFKPVAQSRDGFIDRVNKAGFEDVNIGNTITTDATDFDKIDYDELISIARRFILELGDRS